MNGAHKHRKTQNLTRQLLDDAKRLDFSDVKILSAQDASHKTEWLKSSLNHYINNNYHGSMTWLEDTFERRTDIKTLWPDVKSVIMLTMNYGPEADPLENLKQADIANISVYARHRDYHDVIKGRLKEIAGRFAAKSGEDVKVFVDTAPVMEKPLAQMAGLGWQGKHTNLVSRTQGSWFFLASIFTTAQLEPNDAEIDHCGSCSACLDICPTKAFPAPYQLDARRCISYLTIEHKGMIDRQLRGKFGNRIYGCDDCLAACPWNKFAEQASEIKLRARGDLLRPNIADFLSFDDQRFRKFFSGSPIKRIGHERFIRNNLIAAGNSAKSDLAKNCMPHLKSQSVVIKATAIWALAQLMTKAQFAALKDQYHCVNDHEVVAQEWREGQSNP